MAQVAFEINTTKAEATKTYIYRAAIEYEPDTYTDNDSTSTVRLYVHGSNLPVAENLTGSTSGNSVTLNWEKPANQKLQTT